MSKVSKTRFKITCEDNRVYYVYATDILQATQKFALSKPTHDVKGNPVTLTVAKIEEDDQGKWKTSLYEGRNVF